MRNIDILAVRSYSEGIVKFLLLGLVLIANVAVGCATIVTGPTVDVSLTTTPPGAKAQVNGQTYVTTNQVLVPIRRGKEPTIHVEKEGYEPQDVKLNRKFEGWVGGNILFGMVGGLIGLGVDLSTGHAYGVDPDEIHLTLNPLATTTKGQAVSTAVTSPALPSPASDVDSPAIITATRRKNAHAIVIGLEKYRNELPKADYAEQDAKILAQYLSQSLGYEEENVAVLVNDRATKSDFEKYFEGWLPNRVEQDDTVFVYFSGHGAPNPKTGDAFLVPYDGDLVFLDNTGYPLSRLFRNLADLPAKEIIVVLDSCFSGAGGRSVIAKGMRPIITEVTGPNLGNGKTVLIAASTGQQVSSSYDEKGHGLMTYFFLKGLRGEGDTNEDGKVEITELFEYLRPQVEKVARRQFNSEQTPQLLGSSEVLTNGINLVQYKRDHAEARIAVIEAADP
jgi:uncharacterized caspase-like protein